MPAPDDVAGADIHISNRVLQKDVARQEVLPCPKLMLVFAKIMNAPQPGILATPTGAATSVLACGRWFLLARRSSRHRSPSLYSRFGAVDAMSGHANGQVSCRDSATMHRGPWRLVNGRSWGE